MGQRAVDEDEDADLGLRRFRCVCVCVCVERHLPATVAYSQVSVQSVVCMPTACRVLLVFFLSLSLFPSAFLPAKYLDYRCRHKLCSPSDDMVPSSPPPLLLLCVLSVCLTKCKMSSFLPLLRCVCVYVFPPPSLGTTL